MTINSKEKGKRGEREFALLCRDYGIKKARRGQQYSGIEGRDVVGLQGIHVEVKRAERINVEKALKQAEKDNQGKDMPIVAHRRNREKWKVTMRATDWLKLYKHWIEGRDAQ